MTAKPVLQSRMIPRDMPLGRVRGPAYPVTPEWQQAVRDRLVEMGWNQSDLARAINGNSAMVSHLLKHGMQSALVPLIHKALGWPPPPMPDDSIGDDDDDIDPRAAELDDLFAMLPDDAKELILSNARMLAGVTKKD